MTLKKHFHVFLLVSILMLKLVSSVLHLFSHKDHEEDSQDVCELCEDAILNQDAETYIPNLNYDVAYYEIRFHEKLNLYQSIAIKSNNTLTLFSRPPPTI